jgi:UDP-N-acetylmuramoyl-L-alanyl-D-glutamate--2,6-diaminopimelate ligase
MLKSFIKKITPKFLLKIYHYKLALLGALFYGFPSRKLIVFGVTGTNGKTTVVDFMARVFEEGGFKTASMSSIRFKIGEQEWGNKLKMTMPGRMKIQKFLRQAVRAGCTHAVLEVTSEGIRQYRHKFIDFTGAVFTNLTPEHIESHGSFEKYRACKEELFKAAKGIHIINLDDEGAQYFLKYEAEKKWGYGTRISNFPTCPAGRQFPMPDGQKIYAENIQNLINGEKFLINRVNFELNLIGEFNIYNSLAAVCAGLSQGVSLEKCVLALAKIKAEPGRMEVVSKNPMVIVDYAHNPGALEQVYKNISDSKPKNSRMICVLGSCGGGRDKWKRPVLGKLTADYCDGIIITNEDPYDDDPDEIMDEVAKGAGNKAEKVSDRREAIKKAISLTRPEDVVVITGKGCEPWMCVANGTKIPWDDRQIVREELEKLKK